MRTIEIKKSLDAHCALILFNKKWVELDLLPVAQMHKKAKPILQGSLFGGWYGIFAYGKKRFLQSNNFTYEVVVPTPRLIVRQEMEHREIDKISKKIVQSKGRSSAWAFAQRISRAINAYPITNRRRQSLAELAICIRTNCQMSNE